MRSHKGLNMVEELNETVTAVMAQINHAWLEGHVEDMAQWIHPDIVMILPNFQGRSSGREAFLAGFHDFVRQATVHKFREFGLQTNVVGDTAVVHFEYEMVYELSGEQHRATGRDLWVFQRQGETWLAVWRAMVDTNEQAA